MRLLRLHLSVPILLLALASGVQAQTALKIAYIDSQAILDQDPAAQQAEAQFEEDLSRYRAEVQQLGEELQTLIQQYEQQEAMLSEEAKSNRQEEIRLKQNRYQERIQQLDEQSMQRQAELVEPVMQRINQVIEQIRAEGSYSLIFDVAAQGIISADPALDLTAEVVRRLQAASAAGNTGGVGSS
jgi:outer membrane protein